MLKIYIKIVIIFLWVLWNKYILSDYSFMENFVYNTMKRVYIYDIKMHPNAIKL